MKKKRREGWAAQGVPEERNPLGPYRRPLPRLLGGSWLGVLGLGVFCCMLQKQTQCGGVGGAGSTRGSASAGCVSRCTAHQRHAGSSVGGRHESSLRVGVHEGLRVEG